MPDRGSRPVEAGPSRARRASDRTSAPRAAVSKLELPGIDPDSLTPEARATLARLVAERDQMLRELADARERIVQLERLADEDSLAPIANRRAFIRELGRMIAFTRRYNVPSAVIYFDVNGMKQINDTHGHPAGDAALRHVADVLCKNVRSSDVVGRLGGDEFGVILAQSNLEQANAKSKSLAEAISGSRLRWGKLRIPVSAAYGVYTFSGDDNAQIAIEAADKAMYQHKRVAQAG